MYLGTGYHHIFKLYRVKRYVMHQNCMHYNNLIHKILLIFVLNAVFKMILCLNIKLCNGVPRPILKGAELNVT